MGTKTFGKGSVQSVLPLGSAGGIKLTTARYFTPKGTSIQAKGITPDVEVEEIAVAGDERKPLAMPVRIREADLEHHLSNPNGDKPGKVVPADKPATPDKTDEAPVNPREPNPKTDNQLAQALNILKVQQILQKP